MIGEAGTYNSNFIVYWLILDHKMCQDQSCKKYVHIKSGRDAISITEDFSVEFDKKTFTTSQAEKLSNHFSFSHIGDTLLGKI